MGSVMSDIECPWCGYEYAMIDTYYKTDEEYVSCSRCGFGSSRTIVNWDDRTGNPDEAWAPKYEEESHKTPHAFAVSKMVDGGIRSCGGLKRNQLKDFIRDVKNSVEAKYATYTYKYRGVWYIKDVFTGEKKEFRSVYEDDDNNGVS